MIKVSRLRSRNRLLLATVIGAVAAAVAALATPALAGSALSGTTSPGYPPPKGIYANYTNCPLNNPLMHESVTFSACIWGHATTGTITLGNITTPVTEPVTVQFGVYDSAPVQFDYPLPTVSPLSGATTITKTAPDVIPGTLSDALSCSTATDATIVGMCQKIAADPSLNQVTALASSTGPITEFNLFTWAQPEKFKLINPLLGPQCTIGTNDDPVLLHPQLSILPGGTLSAVLDPDQVRNPSVEQLRISGAQAADSTFSAPGVTGCGPGGVADIAVENALDTWAGLPAASGNTLSLQGNFWILGGFGPENFPVPVPQPADAAQEVLQAFQDSTTGNHGNRHAITLKHFKHVLHITG